MKALILAAGEGTRLRPLTANVPKPMLYVAGKPLIAHLFANLSGLGIEEVALVVGWKSTRIKEYFSDKERAEGLEVTFFEQKERLGTAHAIGLSRDYFDDQFVCLNGDVVLSSRDIEKIIELSREQDGTAIGGVEVDDPRRFGVIETENGAMERIVEKPGVASGNLINAGIMVLTPGIFDAIDDTKVSARGEYEITDTLNMVAQENRIAVYRLKDEWMDVAMPWDLLEANRLLLSNIEDSREGEVEGGAVIHGNIVVEKGARIRSGSYLEGPVHISKGCDIGPNCYIRPSTTLGPGCRVGNAVEIKNSLVMSDTKIPHHTYLGDSVIGERCNLGSGTKIANLRFDDNPVRVTHQGAAVDTGRRKLGVIMGDGVKTGINATIDVGTIIGGGARIGPGAVVRGTIGPNSWLF